VILEEPGWTKRRIGSLLPEMHSARQQGLRILLGGVFGGKLAEGIDYHGNILDGIACIGIPAAPPSVRNDALKEHLGELFGREKQWKYAIIQPAVNSILQAAGRAIRKEEDRAFILLLDSRLHSPAYKACLPRNLTPFNCPESKVTRRHVKRFFERHSKAAN
jgi:Rad3-related DNA helicase